MQARRYHHSHKKGQFQPLACLPSSKGSMKSLSSSIALASSISQQSTISTEHRCSIYYCACHVYYAVTTGYCACSISLLHKLIAYYTVHSELCTSHTVDRRQQQVLLTHTVLVRHDSN